MKYAMYAVAGVIVLALGFFAATRLGAPPQDGEIKFGFIQTVETEDGYAIAFDEAKWLTGKEGEDAAINVGLCNEETRSQCLPNDFFILNESNDTTTFPMHRKAIIAMMTLNMETENVHETQISAEEFAKLINDKNAHWHTLPYQIMVSNGVISIIEEVYIP